MLQAIKIWFHLVEVVGRYCLPSTARHTILMTGCQRFSDTLCCFSWVRSPNEQIKIIKSTTNTYSKIRSQKIEPPVHLHQANVKHFTALFMCGFVNKRSIWKHLSFVDLMKFWFITSDDGQIIRFNNETLFHFSWNKGSRVCIMYIGISISFVDNNIKCKWIKSSYLSSFFISLVFQVRFKYLSLDFHKRLPGDYVNVPYCTSDITHNWMKFHVSIYKIATSARMSFSCF